MLSVACEILVEETTEALVEAGGLDGSMITGAATARAMDVEDIIEGGHEIERFYDRKWCTYTLTRQGSATSRYNAFAEYYGRSSGPANTSDEAIIGLRALGHHKRRDGFGNVTLDGVCLEGSSSNWRNSAAYRAKRGREQQLIDQDPHICAVDKVPVNKGVGNEIRGVSRINVRGCDYWSQSNLAEPNVQTYTGNVVTGGCPPRPTVQACN